LALGDRGGIVVKSYRKHVLVCGGSDCAERNGEELLAALKKAVRSHGLKDVKVTKSGCLGECEEGPHVVVYPEGVWYSGIGLEDLDRIVAEHLVEGVIPREIASFVLGATGKV
jgi:sirohydrochlorin cobaltochelatase